MQEGTGQGECGKRKRTQCGIRREWAVDVWHGECWEYRRERSGTAGKAAWAWKRREGALEGAREITGNWLLIEHMYGKDVNTLWEVLCALEGKRNSEEEVQQIRQGVATRVGSRHNMGEMEECLPKEEVSWQKYIQRKRQGRKMGRPPEVKAWVADGGYKMAVYRETKTGDRYRRLMEYGDGTPLDAGILWTKQRAYAVLWGVRGPRSDAAEVAAAVQRVLDNAQDGQEWPEEMLERARRQVIPGNGKCLYWALSAVDGAGREAGAEEVRTALTEGDMARPPESGSARRVMRDAGARTWEQYLDRVHRGEIWGGACEVGRWAQSKGGRIAKYQEWGPRGVYRKMAEVGEGKRTAGAPLWSRRGGGHYELLWPQEEEEAEAVAEAEEGDRAESKGEVEEALEVELAEEGQEKGGEKGGHTEEQVWQDVHQIQIRGRSERWWYQGQEGPGRERREVGGGGGTERDKKLRAGSEGVLGVQVQRGGVGGGARGYREG